MTISSMFIIYVKLWFQVWTSQLKRAVDTAQYLKGVSIERWKALNEMDHVSYFVMQVNTTLRKLFSQCLFFSIKDASK